MKAHMVRPDELERDHVTLWRQFQQATPELDSPFFAPDFVQAVGEARDDARIAILEEQGAIIGFFPHHRLRSGVGRPIGGPISDYQGVIHAPGAAIDADALLKAADLKAFDFNHAPATQTGVRRPLRPALGVADHGAG